jgi:PAS domain S-box-containing protein
MAVSFTGHRNATFARDLSERHQLIETVDRNGDFSDGPFDKRPGKSYSFREGYVASSGTDGPAARRSRGPVPEMYHDDPRVAQIILDSVADGVFTVDLDWNITSFNSAAEQITGVSRAAANGRPCCEVFRTSICETDCALKQTLESDQPIVNKRVFIVDADGQTMPVSISTAILRDASGTVIGGVATFRDLSLIERLREEIRQQFGFADIIGRSEVMEELFNLVPIIASSDSTVVIEGASGTGKELFARAIHDYSKRRHKPFVAINCGALPDTLLESELFGHKAGAFTDARRDRKGKFAAAEGGSVFLDEIGDISPAMQARLLRFLQERVYEPLGSEKLVKADVRIVAATHRDLQALVREGRFREDLFYRLKVIRITLPDLRDRTEDIPLLVEHFVHHFNRIQGKSIRCVSDDVMRVLMSHEYPGNVRELENIIEHAFVLCDSDQVELRHLPPEFSKARASRTHPRQEGRSLQSIEAHHISEALRRHDGNRKAVADELGIHPTTLLRKMKAFGIEPPPRNGRGTRHRG